MAKTVIQHRQYEHFAKAHEQMEAHESFKILYSPYCGESVWLNLVMKLACQAYDVIYFDKQITIINVNPNIIVGYNDL